MSVRSSSSGGHLLSTAGRHDLEPPCELLSGLKDPGIISKLIRQVKSYFGRYGSRVGHAFTRVFMLLQTLQRRLCFDLLRLTTTYP